ncbi:hypothetical protein ACFTY7_14330 [Streptomyces sp. NPDC057062]|uniref:IS110 family transposase n=1 Tax=unclassified Streptomyces TaxID=2593676 RepID=UPI001C6E17B6|nr:IS110 family transposase [Streptomyces sp. MBT84]
MTGIHTNIVPTIIGPEIILGVDTHKDIHVAALITSTGVLLEHKAFPADSTGYRMLTTWARSQGPVHEAGVELQARQGFRGQHSRRPSISSRPSSSLPPPICGNS